MQYLHLGRLLALTVLQGGSEIPAFEKPLAQYKLTGSIQEQLGEQDLVKQVWI